jgi:hypothetical protein
MPVSHDMCTQHTREGGRENLDSVKGLLDKLAHNAGYLHARGWSRRTSAGQSSKESHRGKQGRGSSYGAGEQCSCDGEGFLIRMRHLSRDCELCVTKKKKGKNNRK